MKYVVTFGGNYFVNGHGEIVRDFKSAKKLTLEEASGVAARMNRNPKNFLGTASVWEAEINHKLITVKVYYDVIQRRKAVRGQSKVQHSYD